MFQSSARRGLITVALVAPLALGAAGVAQADDTTWSYVGQFPSREGCQQAAEKFYGDGYPGEFRCTSNGNPASGAEGTFALYNVYYN